MTPEKSRTKKKRAIKPKMSKRRKPDFLDEIIPMLPGIHRAMTEANFLIELKGLEVNVDRSGTAGNIKVESFVIRADKANRAPPAARPLGDHDIMSLLRERKTT